MMQKKNELHPFEDAGSLEFLSQKNDCSLFVFGNNSKKRPNNLVFVSSGYDYSPPHTFSSRLHYSTICFHRQGRTYDGHLLDMMELGVKSKSSLSYPLSFLRFLSPPPTWWQRTGYQGLTEFSGAKMAVGSKPCLVFEGSGWEHNPDLQKLQNYFTGSSFVGVCQEGIEQKPN